MHASVGLLLALAASANAYVAPGAMPLTGARSVSRPPRHALWRCRHNRMFLLSLRVPPSRKAPRQAVVLSLGWLPWRVRRRAAASAQLLHVQGRPEGRAPGAPHRAAPMHSTRALSRRRCNSDSRGCGLAGCGVEQGPHGHALAHLVGGEHGSHGPPLLLLRSHLVHRQVRDRAQGCHQHHFHGPQARPEAYRHR